MQRHEGRVSQRISTLCPSSSVSISQMIFSREQTNQASSISEVKMKDLNVFACNRVRHRIAIDSIDVCELLLWNELTSSTLSPPPSSHPARHTASPLASPGHVPPRRPCRLRVWRLHRARIGIGRGSQSRRESIFLRGRTLRLKSFGWMCKSNFGLY